MKLSIDPETGCCMHTFYRDDDKYRTCLDCGDSECRCCGEAVCELDKDDESPLDEPIDFEPPHQSGCICADCSGAELTADND